MEKKTHTLYFINTPAPTAEDKAHAAALGQGVVFRNARFVQEDDTDVHVSIEKCDFVAGAVPMIYATRFTKRVVGKDGKIKALKPSAANAYNKEKEIIAPVVAPDTGTGTDEQHPLLQPVPLNAASNLWTNNTPQT